MAFARAATADGLRSRQEIGDLPAVWNGTCSGRIPHQSESPFPHASNGQLSAGSDI